jgi:hypothetical protein
MTVFNRSNDLIFGCCGANAVHFAILQEYVASMLGIKIGVYYQISTNLHMYKEHYDMFLKRISDLGGKYLHSFLWNSAEYGHTQPLVDCPELFDEELGEIMGCIDAMHEGQEYYEGNIVNTFLRETVIPMALAHSLYKKMELEEALEIIETVRADDWRKAGQEWLERHIK